MSARFKTSFVPMRELMGALVDAIDEFVCGSQRVVYKQAGSKDESHPNASFFPLVVSAYFCRYYND
jgi:hypothetical protein